MKTTTLCAVAFLLFVTSSAFAVSVDRDITADYVKANPKEFTVSVTEEANGLLAFTVVFTTPDPRYVVAHLVVRNSEKIYATSDTPSFMKNRSNTVYFSIPGDLVATSTFSLGVSGFADSGGEAVPLPGTITNKLQLLDFVPQKAAGIKGVTFHLSSGEDFLVDKDTVIAKLANVVQSGEEKLQGEWRVTGMRVKGHDVKVAELGDGVYIFAKNQLKVTGAAKSVAEMTLRPDSEPKELDLKAIEGVGAGKTVYGLYRFEGEKLVLCIGNVRDSTFAGDDDAGLLVLERFVSPAVIAAVAFSAQDEAAPSTLKAAVAKFNQETQTHPIGKSQFPLTEDEVIAAIRGWIPESTPYVTDKIFNAFQEIAESRKLPPDGVELSFRADWAGYRGFRFDLWWIDLTIKTGENDACLFRIRDQKISSRKMTAEELAEEQAAIKAPLEAR